MVARDHDPSAIANAALGDEHGGNLDQPAADLPAPLADPVEPVTDDKPKDDKPKDDKPKPGPSGPGLRTTNTPTRRGR